MVCLKSKILSLVLVVFAWAGCLGEAAGICYDTKLLSGDFWEQNYPMGNKVLLDGQGIEKLNAKIRQATPTVVDLVNFSQEIEGASLKENIGDFQVLNEDLYLNGKKVSDNYKQILRQQANLEQIHQWVHPKYGVILRRTSLRNLPTAQPLFYYPQDKEFDALQETMLEPCEPVLVLHNSANGFLAYVQAANYRGWVSIYNLGLTDRKTWLEYANPKQFLIVTATAYTLDLWGEKILFQLGAKIPYREKTAKGYLINLPIRDKKGKLGREEKIIPLKSSVREGYLPYTAYNLLRCAMMFHGMPYGWGGMHDSVDCSGLLYCIHRAMGIILPRNADEQMETCGLHHDFSLISGYEERINAICGLSPGTSLFMDGHCFLYMGNVAGKPYVLHALGSYWDGKKVVPVMQVVLSELDLLRTNSRTYAEEILQGVEYR